MASLEQVSALMSPTLTAQLGQLKSVPKSKKSTAAADFFGSFNFPQIWERRNQLITIHTTYKKLDKKIADLSEKVTTIQLPMDISKKDSFSQFFQKEMTLNKLGILELDEGIKLLAERSDTANVAKLKADLAVLKKNIEEAKPKMEAHFVKLAKQQHMYKLALELREMVQLFEKRTPPATLAALPQEKQTVLNVVKNIAFTSQMAEDEFKALFAQAAAIVREQPEAAREMRHLAADARRLNQPENLIAEQLMQKNPSVTKEQVLKMIAGELPAIAKKALAHPSEGWYVFSTPQPAISQRLNEEEMQMVRAMESADFAKTAPDTLITYAKKALQVIEKGFAAMPADVAAKRELLNRGIEVYEQQFKVKRLDADQRKVTAAQVAIDMVHVIDRAFASKTAAGTEILKRKLLPTERDALVAVKAKMASLQNDAAKLKATAQSALDMIDKAFLSDVQPLRSVPVPAELKAEMAEIRKNLKLIA